MSRSYREPWYVAGYGWGGKRFVKRRANRVVRKAKDVPDGKAYRKYFDSWEITDYKFMWDSRTRYYWISGELKAFEPDPEWRVRRK